MKFFKFFSHSLFSARSLVMGMKWVFCLMIQFYYFQRNSFRILLMFCFLRTPLATFAPESIFCVRLFKWVLFLLLSLSHRIFLRNSKSRHLLGVKKESMRLVSNSTVIVWQNLQLSSKIWKIWLCGTIILYVTLPLNPCDICWKN